ncbi:hypothetical protein OK074_4201 [Actinobacteria bacterium OK074]|nr:hypothetical protein OK074_4201 [Actinobacteria bacterium OK074]
MHSQLHGRGALFDTEPPGLAPRLVGLQPSRLRTSPFEPFGPEASLPFVVFAGGRGLGKSAVLGGLHAAYLGITPVAFMDGEAPPFAGPPGDRPAASWSPLAHALTTVAEQLAGPVRGGTGRIHFPRLASGLLAVAASGWRHTDEPRIRREAERILLLNDAKPFFEGFAGRWVSKVISKLLASMSGTGPVVAPVIEATLEAFSEGVSPTHRRLRRAATWYRDYPNAGGNPKLGLIFLSQQFRAGGDSRRHAERYLVRALLADLDEAYGGAIRRSRHVGRPVVLVDNVQEPAGHGLMECVLRDRADGIADQVVFFAALRGYVGPPPAERPEAGAPGDASPDSWIRSTPGLRAAGTAALALRHARRQSLPELTRHTNWTPGATPSTRALLVTLPPLTPDDTLHLVGAVCQGITMPPQLPPAIHRLTGGNPLGCALLARSAARNLPELPPPAASLGALLTAHVAVQDDHDGRPTHLELLDRLVPGGRLDELTLLAAAHDDASARALAEAHLPEDFGAAGVLDLAERLATDGWPPAAGQFVGDPFLRALLLLRLHHQDRDHTRWRSAHQTLIDHYSADGSETAAGYRLHHELALGHADLAVAHLRDSFPDTAPAAWLGTLVFIASAPYYHAHDPDDGHDFTFTGAGAHRDDRAAVALGERDAEWRPPAGVDAVLHLRVRRLLYAVWQLTDPLVLPEPRVAERLRFELEQLSNLRPESTTVLWRASRDWPRDALAGRPLVAPREGAAPGTPDDEHGGR